MIKNDLDFGLLAGFELVAPVDGAIDFRDEAFGARAGAKRGGGEAA